MFDLDCALKVDFENYIGAHGHAVFDGFLGRAVAVVVHMGPFDKSVGSHHGVKFLLRHKKVFAPVLFLAAWRARGV